MAPATSTVGIREFHALGMCRALDEKQQPGPAGLLPGTPPEAEAGIATRSRGASDARSRFRVHAGAEGRTARRAGRTAGGAREAYPWRTGLPAVFGAPPARRGQGPAPGHPEVHLARMVPRAQLVGARPGTQDSRAPR